ncbi:MAG: type II toxin-antitoxin system VapC family toxin [Candidatus Hydrogenedentes bacterium]|nr:type II toxin-antitoxin system VapC family toxin [Candidatus Hydrogenedentota bacterium]
MIDTDIIIYALKGEAWVLEEFRRHSAHPKAISIITYGELLFGALKSERREENLARARRTGELFQVVEVTRAVIETFASLKASLGKSGAVLDDFDLVIAATAITLGYKLVTNNERHFRRVPGLEVENWAKP